MNRVELFLKTFNSKQTINQYRYALNLFFKHIYGNGNDKLEENADRYFKEIRNYEEDITNFFVSVKDRPPKTVQSTLSIIRTFLSEQNVEIPDKFWRKLRGRKKGTRALTQDRVPSNQDLKKIIMNMPPQGKALYLMLASSGMRIGEALKLRPQDIDLEQIPVKVNIRGEISKTGNPRITFISGEAKEALIDWLRVRGQYLKVACAKSSRYKKSMNDERIFPFEFNTAYLVWVGAIEKAGYAEKDSSTNRFKAHPHTLRKFFRTKMGSVIPQDVVEAFIGHEAGLSEVYRRYSDENLAEFYKQGESALLIFTDSESVAKLRGEVQTQSKQLQNIINGVVAENLELKQRIAEMQKTDLMTLQVLEYLLKQFGTEELKQAVRKTGVADKAWEREDRLKAKIVDVGRRGDLPTQAITTEGFDKFWNEYKRQVGSYTG